MCGGCRTYELSMGLIPVRRDNRLIGGPDQRDPSIPWCYLGHTATHRPERFFRFAFLADLGLAGLRSGTVRRGFRLAGFDSAGAIGFASGAVGFGAVSSRQNFWILSVTRMSSIVCRPRVRSSSSAVSVVPSETSRSVSKKSRRACSPRRRWRSGPPGTNIRR